MEAQKKVLETPVFCLPWQRTGSTIITVQFPALSDMLGGRRKGLPPKCPPACFRKKNVPIQPWLTWLSLLALGCS